MAGDFVVSENAQTASSSASPLTGFGGRPVFDSDAREFLRRMGLNPPSEGSSPAEFMAFSRELGDGADSHALVDGGEASHKDAATGVLGRKSWRAESVALCKTLGLDLPPRGSSPARLALFAEDLVERAIDHRKRKSDAQYRRNLTRTRKRILGF